MEKKRRLLQRKYRIESEEEEEEEEKTVNEKEEEDYGYDYQLNSRHFAAEFVNEPKQEPLKSSQFFSPQFNLNSKQFFLTYPKCSVKKEEFLKVLLEEKFKEMPSGSIEYLIAEEKHKDGSPHLHVYIKLPWKKHIRRPTFFDIKGHHGRYETVRSANKVIGYCCKHSQQGSNSSSSQNYLTNIEAVLNKLQFVTTSTTTTTEDEDENQNQDQDQEQKDKENKSSFKTKKKEKQERKQKQRHQKMKTVAEYAQIGVEELAKTMNPFTFLSVRKSVHEYLQDKDLRPQELPPFEHQYFEWQLSLLEILNNSELAGDGRSIYWIIDQEGGKGKTTFAKHLAQRQNTFYCKIDPKEQPHSILFRVKESHKLFLIDVPRASINHVNYSFLETLKDGIWENGKYTGSSVNRKGNATIIVFANDAPKIDQLSLDRWRIFQITATSASAVVNSDHQKKEKQQFSLLPISVKELLSQQQQQKQKKQQQQQQYGWPINGKLFKH